jgi:hypothetical protein
VNNYIRDHNRFKLAGPPKWFLRRLWEFDSSLVIIPSRQSFCYRLAQRRKLNLSEKIVNEALFNQSDTQMMATYGLVPVTTVMATVNWDNPYLFVELANRAPWRMGGADKVNADLDQHDLEQEIKKQQLTDEHLTSQAKDGWKLYRKKIGLGSTTYFPTAKPAPSRGRVTLT